MNCLLLLFLAIYLNFYDSNTAECIKIFICNELQYTGLILDYFIPDAKEFQYEWQLCDTFGFDFRPLEVRSTLAAVQFVHLLN